MLVLGENLGLIVGSMMQQTALLSFVFMIAIVNIG
jgi:hypothetical protein